MTIAAVPPPGIDVTRVAPAGEAAAGGFDELLAGAQTEAPDETRPAPVPRTGTKRPVRHAPPDAAKTHKDATDTDATEATDAPEQPPAKVTDAADTTAATDADAAPVAVVPVVAPPTLPEQGVGHIVLEALAELDGTAASKAEVAVVVTDTTVPDTVTMHLPFATDAAPEPANGDVEVPVDSAPLEIVPDAAPDTPVAVTDETPVSGTTPQHHGRAPAHAAREVAKDAIAPVTADTSRPEAAPTNETRATPAAPTTQHEAAPMTVATVEAPPLTPASQPADDDRGPSQHASPTAIAAVAAHEMPAVSRGAAVSAMHTASAPAAAPPAEQLVSVLRPLRNAPDGSYRIRLELRPPELGRVELRVEMRDGVLSASLHTDNEGAATTLQHALGDLRARLEATGVRAGTISVDDGRTGTDRHANRDAPRDRANRGVPDSGITHAPAVTTGASADGALDVRL